MPPPASHSWDVIIAYEIRMFRATYETLLDSAALSRLEKVLQNAVEESAVLHTRILCDVFLSRSSEPDDIILSKLFPGLRTNARYARLKGMVDDLRRRYGAGNTANSHCWVFNKMMAHPTTHRSDSYDYTVILRGLQPIIQGIIAEIESLRGVAFQWKW